jgi:hypothetical protein
LIDDFNQIAFQYFGGIDLMAIEGLSHAIKIFTNFIGFKTNQWSPVGILV